MYTLYKFHFLNGISEINQLFDDILIIWPAPVFILKYKILKYNRKQFLNHNNISELYCSRCIFDQINAAWVSRRDFLNGSEY